MAEFEIKTQVDADIPDWRPTDVMAGSKKRGHCLAALPVALGYHVTAAGKALKRSWPAVEAVIAQAIGVAPQQI